MGTDNLVKSFQEWNKRTDEKYIRAICKPCWELKFCPYGGLVESFPLGNRSESEICIIFGHICPVFYVAEPFTETKELRNISRNIPNSVRRKVDRRDGMVCSICKRIIDDCEVNYDHIIPWSKGGPTTESNLRIVCSECNKKRGNSFESQYLVANALEWRFESKKLKLSMLKDLLTLFLVYQIIKRKLGDVTEIDFCKIITDGSIETDKFMYGIIVCLMDIFDCDNFFIPVKKKETLLRYRWGLVDNVIHSITETCMKYRVSEEYYIEQENLLLRQLGFIVDVKSQEEYSELTVNSPEIETTVTIRMKQL